MVEAREEAEEKAVGVIIEVVKDEEEGDVMVPRLVQTVLLN